MKASHKTPDATGSEDTSNRSTVSISISVPTDVVEAMNASAMRRGMTRSQYITWLIRNNLYVEHGLLPDIQSPPLPKISPRIKPKD